MNRRRGVQRGFTLLELLVAVGVFAVMSVMAYGGLKSVLDSRVHTDAQAKRLAAVQLTFTRLQRDLEQLTDRSIRDEFGDYEPALRTDIGTDITVEFTHAGWSNPTNAPRSHLQRVAYSMKDNKLYRGFWLVLDRAQDSVAVPAMVLDRVKAVEWRFMDSANKWQTSWPPLTPTATGAAAPPALPRAVEVTLELEDLGRLTRLFRVAMEPPAGPPATP